MSAEVNGVALLEDGEQLDADALRERAWGELLRQEAVRVGLLPAGSGMGEVEQEAIQRMLEDAVPLGHPAEAECARYYAAHPGRFTRDRRALVRHILFAVTEGIDVQALAAHAERALREVARTGRFAELARELSNCPSGAQGGELGWIAPHECADEFAAALFEDGDAPAATGLLPRLVHSRHGLHVVEVLDRQAGQVIPYEQVRGRIAQELAQRSRATALHQYMRALAGRARITGIAVETA